MACKKRCWETSALSFAGLVARYPGEASGVVLVLAVILHMLFNRARGTGGEFDFSLFGGNGDGGDGGGD